MIWSHNEFDKKKETETKKKENNIFDTYKFYKLIIIYSYSFITYLYSTSLLIDHRNWAYKLIVGNPEKQEPFGI